MPGTVLGTGDTEESKNSHSLHPHYDYIPSFAQQIPVDRLLCVRYCSGHQNKTQGILASQVDYIVDGGGGGWMDIIELKQGK